MVCASEGNTSITSHKHNTMTNTELTLDQLTAIAGGVKMGPDGKTCTDRHIWRCFEDIYVFGNGANDDVLKTTPSSLRSDNRF